MDRYEEIAREHTAEMAGALAKVGVALLALPLADLPAIASMQALHDSLGGLRVTLQLGGDSETAPGLIAWAEVLPERVVAVRACTGYLRVEVHGVLDGVPVIVWDHIGGAAMGAACDALAVPADGETHLITCYALRVLTSRKALADA